MAHEETLVEITTMPSLSHNTVLVDWDKQGVFPKAQGIVLKGWTHWSDHIECKAQYLDILTNGQVIRYWRPMVDDIEGEDLESSGFWEITGEGRQSYEISSVQCTINQQNIFMVPGDLVKFRFPKKTAGALTALKYAKRMEARIKGRTGLILEINDNNAMVAFEEELIVCHAMFLEVISV